MAYVLATFGAIRLLFFQRKMTVPGWQIVFPLAALVVLGYTIYRNVLPYPKSGPPHWFPIVAGGWILLCALVVVVARNAADRLGRSLAADEGFATERAAPSVR